MKTLAFNASNSKNSINRRLLEHAVDVLKTQMETDAEILSVLDFDAPIFSIDTENEFGIPDAAYALREKISEADLMLIAYAEHNGSYVAAYKSLFDWMTRIEGKVFAETPMVILATSPGKGGAKSVLAQAEASAPFFGAEIKGTFSLPSYFETFDNDKGIIADAEHSRALSEALSNLSG